jgi:hypothetical protein
VELRDGYLAVRAMFSFASLRGVLRHFETRLSLLLDIARGVSADLVQEDICI